MGNFSEGHANGLPGGKSAEQLRKIYGYFGESFPWCPFWVLL